MPSEPTEEYTGPAADAKAAAIGATLGTDAETAADVVWLLRYTTAKHNIQWPDGAEIVEASDPHGSNSTPLWQGQPITAGWWWLQFPDGPGPRHWDGTFWDRGSYFATAHDYAENPVLGPCVPPGKWRRYRPGDVMEFGALVAGVSPRGAGRMTLAQHLLPQERYFILPPLSEID